ncbi:MAG: hypothetical protein IT289_08415 [Oligoflexia bacterium]|nr:hypothetical protein [Oligoflexia bacterium]
MVHIKQNIFIRLMMCLSLLAFASACSDIRLAKRNISTYSVNDGLKGSFCAQPPLSTSTPMKVVFLIDMSLSNIGRITDGGAFDRSQATDPTAVRIQKAIDYINNCSGTSANKFAIIGFSDTILNNPPTNDRCRFFRDKNTALNDLNVLKNQQTAANAQPTGVMQTTYYSAAFDCLDTLVREDIGNTDPRLLKSQFYTSFFLTDGAPTTQNGEPIPTNQAFQYANKVKSTAFNAKQATGGFLLQSVYYGNLDYGTAQQFLDPISQAGGTTGTIKIDDLSRIDFCTLARSPIRVPYNITQFAVINATAHMKNQALLPDSDGDGVIDSEDGAPTNRRGSSILIDAVCKLMGPGCANFIPTSCDATKVDPFFGLSECDREAMSLAGVHDQDLDGIPDSVEILKGSLPLTYDADQQSGDGLTLIEKIRRGRQVYFYENKIPEAMEMRYKLQPIGAGSCGAGGTEWSFDVFGNPLVPTLAYSTSNANENEFMGHAANENVLLVYYFAQPVNSSLLGTQVYVSRPLRMKYGSKDGIYLRPGDFRLVGEIPTR